MLNRKLYVDVLPCSHTSPTPSFAVLSDSSAENVTSDDHSNTMLSVVSCHSDRNAKVCLHSASVLISFQTERLYLVVSLKAVVSLCYSVCVYITYMCVCVSVCERERVCVFVCVCAWSLVRFQQSIPA